MSVVVSVYRLLPEVGYPLRPNTDFWHALWRNFTIGGRPAQRIDRIAGSRPPEWAASLERMTGWPFDHVSHAPGAVLLAEVGTSTYALAFGSGWHMLRPDVIERDF